LIPSKEGGKKEGGRFENACAFNAEGEGGKEPMRKPSMEREKKGGGHGEFVKITSGDEKEFPYHNLRLQPNPKRRGATAYSRKKGSYHRGFPPLSQGRKNSDPEERRPK